MGDIVRKVKDGRFIGWYVRYRDTDGRRKQRASHQPTHALARQYLRAVEGRITRGLVGIPELAPPQPTVQELITRFLNEYTRPQIKDLDKYRLYARTALRRALPRLGKLAAESVQPADVDKLRQTLGRSLAPSSVRLTLDFLNTVYSWAVKCKLIVNNPLRSLEKPAARGTAAGVTEYLSKAEILTLLSVAEQRASSGTLADRMRYSCVHFALHTGLRRGEIFGLRWSDLDFDTRRLTVARSYRSTPKSGKARHLRLPEEVVPVLFAWSRECPHTAEGLVFPIVTATPRIGADFDTLELPTLLTAAGCRARVRPWHALRHSFASHYMMAGGNILALQNILGHSDLRMTLVYSHLAPDFLAEQMNKVRFK